MKIRVYHAVTLGIPFRSWDETVPLRLIDEIDVPLANPTEADRTRVLETVFRQYNAVDGNERNVKLRVRSLSVGDVVKLDERAYVCASIGWEEIDPARMRMEGGIVPPV